MRKVFEHPAFHEVGHFQSVLRSHGIETVVRNQNVSALSGEVPFTSAYPELWVVDDGEYDRAISLLQDYRTNQSEPGTLPDWNCPNCREKVPGNYSSCWNCDTAYSDEKVPPSSEDGGAENLATVTEPADRVAGKLAPLTIICMLFAAIVFVWMLAEPSDVWNVFYPPSRDIYEGRWDGLLGSVFLHLHFFHLVFNLCWLWTFGSLLETQLPRVFWGCLFLATAFFSSALQLAFSNDTGIGLSGVVYGLFGFLWVAKAQNPSFGKVVSKNLIMVMMGWLLFCFALTYAYPIGNAAHIGGLLAGALIGWCYLRSRNMALFSCGLLVLLAIASTFFAPWSPSFLSVRAYELLKKGESEKAAPILDRLRSDQYLGVWASHSLASLSEQKGDYSRAAEIYETAYPTAQTDAAFLNSYAWFLATAPEEKVRNGTKALEIAKIAVPLSGPDEAAALDTLAAAYAETGDFLSAIKFQTEAIEKGLKETDVLERLELYRQGKAFRQPASGKARDTLK